MTTTENAQTAIKPEVITLPPETGAEHPPAVVEPEPETTKQEAAQVLLDKAADAALMPGVPGRDEFITLAMTARILSMSGAAPRDVQRDPYLAFHIAMVGRDLGISPSASLELIDVIPGSGDRGPRLSLSPQLLNGQVIRLGLGRIVPKERTDHGCIAVAVGADGEVIGESEFTWEDARMASLVGPDCQPGAHVLSVTRNGKGGSTYKVCGCNQGYITYPKRMMWWRAAGFCADDFFPTAGLGMYSPEALGSVVDDEGRPIDPTTVALPSGYEPAPPPPPAEGDNLLPDAEREAFRHRLSALPAPAVAMVKELWKRETEAGRVFLPPLTECLIRQRGKIEGLIATFEGRAAKGEWGDWSSAPPPAAEPPTPPVAETPPVTPVEPSGTDTAPEPTAPQDGSPVATGGDPAPCPVCKGSGMLGEDKCWGCDLATGPCTLCGTTEGLRRTVGGETHCTDQDACWARDPLNPEGERDGTLSVHTPESPAKPACALCGSTRTKTVEHNGVLRCMGVGDCSKRIEAQAAAKTGQ